MSDTAMNLGNGPSRGNDPSQGLVIQHALVLTFRDGEYQVRDNCDIAVRDKRIDAIHDSGTWEIPPGWEVIDASEHFVTPGFVNLHSHGTDTPFTRGLLEDGASRGLGESPLYQNLPAVRAAIEPQDELVAAEASYVERLRSGITTSVEMTYFTEVASRGSLDVVAAIAGMAQANGWRTYIAPRYKSGAWITDGSAVDYEWYPDQGFDRFAECVSFLEGLDSDNTVVHPMLAPAQIDTCTEALMRATMEVADSRDWLIQLHAGQSEIEFFEMVKRTGMSPIEWLESIGCLNQRMILGHGVHFSHHSRVKYDDGSDLERIADTGAAVAHCAFVIGRKGRLLESLPRYLDMGIRVGLGVDTYPQDMLSEMRAAAMFGKVAAGTSFRPNATEVLAAATRGGAEILGRPDLGRIEEHCTADLVLWKRPSSTGFPARDLVKSLVYAQPQASADTVIIDGRVVMRAGQVNGVDESRLADRIAQSAEDVWARIDRIDEIAPRAANVIC